MSQFSQDISIEEKPRVHSLTDEEFEALRARYQELKVLVETQGYQLTIEDQRDIVKWMRVNREVAFVLNQKPAKEPKAPRVKKVKEVNPVSGEVEEKEVVVKVRKKRKIGKKLFEAILIKEMSGGVLTEEEEEDKQRYIGAIE